MRRLVMLIVAMMFVVTTVGTSLAMEQGNKRKEVDNIKPPLNPSDKTQAEWEALFDKRDFVEFGCLEEWEKMSDAEITDIFAYLYAHASDSPTPLKCK